jgi:hypothetical protein
MRVTTTYVGATDTKGSKIVAKGGGKQLTMPYDYSLDVLPLHAKAAALLLRDRFGIDTITKVQNVAGISKPSETKSGKGYAWEVTL